MARYLYSLASLLVAAACSDSLGPERSDQPLEPSGPGSDDPHPPDAGSAPDDKPEVDACPPDAGEGFLFESGVHAGAPTAKTGMDVSTIQLVGVRFTTTQTYTITEVGAFMFTHSPTPAEVVIAVVPLDANGYPADASLSDAIGYGSGVAPTWPTGGEAPGSTSFATSFTLPPGTYGLVVASDRLGAANHEAALGNSNIEAVGDPDFFVYHGDFSGGPYWSEAQTSMDPLRIYIAGN